MSFRKVEVPRNQLALWSQTLDDAISPDHPVRVFDHLFHAEGFQEFLRMCEQELVLVDGRPPYNPWYMAALYLYGMIHGIRSSRALESACYNRIDVLWLMEGQTPDHSSIAGFVKKYKKQLKVLFRSTVRVAMTADLVKFKHQSVDGTKIEADAGRGSVRTQASLEAEQQRLAQAIVERCESEWSQNEQREQAVFVEQSPQGKPTNEKEAKAAKQRLEKLKAQVDAALGAVHQRTKEAEATGGTKPIAVVSKTDPDSRVMPDKQGKSKPGYNALIAVDAHAGVIVAQEVNDRPEDTGQMTPLLEQGRENTGQLPQVVSADSAFNTGHELKKLEEMGVKGHLPQWRQNSGSDGGTMSEAQAKTAEALQAAHEGRRLSEEQFAALPRAGKRDARKFDKSAFTYDSASDSYRCPAGHSLPVLRLGQDKTSQGTVHRTVYGGSPACATCPHAMQCCGNPSKGRTVNRDEFEECRERMRERMKSEEGRATYRLRAQTVEPRFGYIKQGLGVRRFLRRGIETVRAEFDLICAAVNIKTIMGAIARGEASLERLRGA